MVDNRNPCCKTWHKALLTGSMEILTILSLALQAGAGAEREALIRRAADAEKATCALLEQHSREAAAVGVQTSATGIQALST